MQPDLFYLCIRAFFVCGLGITSGVCDDNGDETRDTLHIARPQSVVGAADRSKDCEYLLLAHLINQSMRSVLSVLCI